MLRILRLSLIATAILGTSAASASATQIAVGSGFQGFSFDGIGPITFPADGFQFTALGTVEVRVTDGFIIGDRFNVFVNSVLAGSTSTFAPGDDGVQSNAFTGDSSWADSRLSHLSLLLGPGVYDIDLSVIDNAAGTTGGVAFFEVRSAVPEPASMLLVGSGFGLLARRLRRRKQQA